MANDSFSEELRVFEEHRDEWLRSNRSESGQGHYGHWHRRIRLYRVGEVFIWRMIRSPRNSGCSKSTATNGYAQTDRRVVRGTTATGIVESGFPASGSYSYGE